MLSTNSAKSSQPPKNALQELILQREERSTEMRDQLRRNLLKRNRLDVAERLSQRSSISKPIQDSSSDNSSNIPANNNDLSSTNLTQEQHIILNIARSACKTEDSFSTFSSELLPFDLNKCHPAERLQNFKVLLLALTHVADEAIPSFFFDLASEFIRYFNLDDDFENETRMPEIFEFIKLSLQSPLLHQAKSFIISRDNVQKDYARFKLYLAIASAMTRGNESLCRRLTEFGFLQIFFDIFIATKDIKELATITITAICNFMATKPVWRVYYMQQNFHNIIFEMLTTLPKFAEYYPVHNKICWCLSNTTRDMYAKLLYEGTSQIQSEETQLSEAIPTPEFNNAYMSAFYPTFVAYSQQEIRCDIAWSFTALVSMIFERAKKVTQPSPNNIEALEAYQSLISNEISDILKINFCEFMQLVFLSKDVSSVIPVLRVLNLILGSNIDTLTLFFDYSGTSIEDSVIGFLQHPLKMIKKEAIKTAHYMFLSDYDVRKPFWLNRILPIIMGVLLHSADENMNEEVFKLLNSIIESLESHVFDSLVLSANYCLFRIFTASLSSPHARVQFIQVILEILVKVLTYYQKRDAKLNQIMLLFERDGVMKIVEQLQSHQHVQIYQQAVTVTNIYNECIDSSSIQEEEEAIQSTVQDSQKSAEIPQTYKSNIPFPINDAAEEEEQIQVESTSDPVQNNIHYTTQSAKTKPSQAQKQSDFEKIYEEAKI